MASVRQNVIDLSSSPEPSTPPMSHARPKFKSKQKPRTRTTPLPVIELTDSDSDDAYTLSAQRKKTQANAVAGPSNKPPALQPKTAASGSLENIPNTPNRRLKPSTARPFPLFLASDEENEPPASPFVLVSPQVERLSPFETVEMEGVLPTNPPETIEVMDPEPNVDPTSTYVACVLEIIPDVDPDHLLDLITKSVPTHGDQVVEHVLHSLFEDPTYPKVDRKGKGKRKQTDGEPEGNESPSKKTKIDYRTNQRPYKGGVHYADMALEQLQADFPYIPKGYLRTTLSTFNGFYAPTYFSLSDQEKQHRELQQQSQVVKYPYTRRTTPFHPSKKGKSRVIQDAEFEQERNWLLEELAKDDHKVAEQFNEEEYEDCGDGIECGCCFSTYPFDKMVQCPETHLFCSSCMTSYASTLLGSQDTNIKCMHQSGCTVAISRSELQRFLPKKLMELWDRLTQRKEVQAAGLDGLEECPFCEWGCVIENEEEKLFRCENTDGCGVVSCRGCKKVDHLPKSCKEVEEDKNLDGRHAIEEAMTRALMRNCPKCQKAFIKEYGCNKMTCPECGTLSCYVCRQAVMGYDHFIDRNAYPGGPGHQGTSQEAKTKCILYDGVEQRHADEVKEAAERALEKYKQEHPEVDETAIKVDLPPAPAPQAVLGFPQYPAANPALQNADVRHYHGRLQILEEQLLMLRQRLGDPQAAAVYQEQAQAYARLIQDAPRLRDPVQQAGAAAVFPNIYQVQNIPQAAGVGAVFPPPAGRRNPVRHQPPPPPIQVRRPVGRNRRR